MAYKYPNLAAEMSRSGLDYSVLYKNMAERFGKSTDTLSNWITGRAGELPTSIAFAIRNEYFPNFSVDYLFCDEPIVDMSNATFQSIIEVSR